MAFCLCANVLLDPTIAVAETVQANEEQRGRTDALDLIALQNVPPETYIDIALGRRRRLDRDVAYRQVTPSAVTGVERIPVQLWASYRPEYGAAIKLALIRMEGRSDAVDPKQFLDFLHWMYDDYIFIPGAVAYASLALSPNRGGSMLKNVRSRDSSKVFNGVRNVMWDMALLRYWGRRVQEARESREFPILCSFDQALLTCAADFVGAFSEVDERLNALAQRWNREWGERLGKKLMEVYRDMLERAESDPSRAALRYSHQQRYWEGVVDRLEEQLSQRINRS
jgi:hypothetical protein